MLGSFYTSLDGTKQDTTGTPTSLRSERPSLRRPSSWASAKWSDQPRLKRPYSLVKAEIQRRSTAESTIDMRLTPRTASPLNTAAANSLFIDDSLQASPTSESYPNTGQRIPDEKPIASTNGFTVAIALAEPCLFLQGFDQNELLSNRNTAMLRGSLHLKVTKPSKIKTISLNFTGKATTKWLEGIPPKKVDHEETNVMMNHTWPFFNAQHTTSEHNTGADHVELQQKPESAVAKRMSLDMTHFLRNNSSSTSLSREDKRLSVTSDRERTRSVGRTDASNGGDTKAKGFKLFLPGDYLYNFELPIDSHMPETIDVELGTVKYELEATIERPGAFNKNITGTKEIMVIRTPSESSLEQVEPIAISRNWDNQLHYDIVISGKSFPMGSQIPIAFKLTPLAKVQCHRVKVYVTESVEYYCANKRVHRTEPARRMLLFEKRADSQPVSTFPGGTMRVTSGGGIPYDMRAAASRGEVVSGSDPTNLLGNLESNDAIIGPTEMEVNVQLPTCEALSKAETKTRLHFDTTYANIQVHHWIKIVLRISRPDANDPGKRRHFEISIDSPFHILSCRATHANTSLPAYSYPDPISSSSPVNTCGCPGAPSAPPHTSSLHQTISRAESQARASSELATSASLQPPPAAHVHGDASPANQTATVQSPHVAGATLAARPMHIIRAPSYAPPSFDDEEPPPPLMTPPPQYNDIASPTNGLADYFSRYSDAYATEESVMQVASINNEDPLHEAYLMANNAVLPNDNTARDAVIPPVGTLLARDYVNASSSSSSEESLFVSEAARVARKLSDGDSDGNSEGGSTPTQRRSLNIEMPLQLASGPVVDVR